MQNTPLILIMSGPSGVGKDAIISRLIKRNNDYKYIVTFTTRRKRPNEINGKHYHFVSEDIFNDLIAKDELLEWANVYGNYYGVPKDTVKDSFNKYAITIIKVDIQGAQRLKTIIPDAIYIFITGTSETDLHSRLINRGSIELDDVYRRLNNIENEMKRIQLFDYVVENKPGDILSAVSSINSIIVAERCRVKPRFIEIK